jgi:hypothetical protein
MRAENCLAYSMFKYWGQVSLTEGKGSERLTSLLRQLVL